MPNYVFRSRLAVKRGKSRSKIVNRIGRSRAVKSPHWKYGGHGYIAGEGTGIVCTPYNGMYCGLLELRRRQLPL